MVAGMDVAVASLRWSLGLLAAPHGLNKVYYDLPGFQKLASSQIMKLVPGMPQPAANGLATLGAGLQTLGAFAICLDFFTGPLSAASVVFYAAASKSVWQTQGPRALLWMEESSLNTNPGGFKSVEYLRFGPAVYMTGYALVFGYTATKQKPGSSEPVDHMK